VRAAEIGEHLHRGARVRAPLAGAFLYEREGARGHNFAETSVHMPHVSRAYYHFGLEESLM